MIALSETAHRVQSVDHKIEGWVARRKILKVTKFKRRHILWINQMSRKKKPKWPIRVATDNNGPTASADSWWSAAPAAARGATPPPCWRSSTASRASLGYGSGTTLVLAIMQTIVKIKWGSSGRTKCHLEEHRCRVVATFFESLPIFLTI